MGAYHNALREEGSRKDLLTALEKSWNENWELKKKTERLENSSRTTRDPYDYLRKLITDAKQLTDENRRLRETLLWYSNPRHFNPRHFSDMGKRARAALAGEEKT